MTGRGKAFNHRIEGVDNALAVLQGLEAELRTKILVTAVTAGAKPLVKSIRSAAQRHSDSGATAESIGYSVRKAKKAGLAAAQVGVRRGIFQGERPSRYAHLQEFGHIARDGSQVVAVPFMAPGTSAGASQAAKAVQLGIQRGILNTAKRLYKKTSK